VKSLRYISFFLLKILLPLGCLLPAQHLSAQEAGADYNRFQYHAYRWRVLSTEKYRLYFPEGYDSLCKFTNIHLPEIIEAVKKQTGLSVRDMPQLIIYPSLAQLYESNIGLYAHRPASFPTVILQGDRVMLAFTGSYETFLEQLKEAWVKLCWDKLYHNDAATQLSGQPPLCPEWFKDGCIAFIAGGWSLKDEAALHRRILLTQPGSWEDLLQSDSVQSAKAFCYFLTVQQRGDAMVQLLFRFRQGKSLSRAARLVFKKRLDSLQASCFHFYTQRFKGLMPEQGVYADAQVIQSRLKKGERLLSLAPNASRHLLAWVTEYNHERRVYIMADTDNASGKSNKIAAFRLPPWQRGTDQYHYPLIAWSSNRENLLVIAPEKGKIQVQEYTVSGRPLWKKKLDLPDGLTAFIEEAPGKWLMAVYRSGQGDIVQYHSGKDQYLPLTHGRADHYLLKENRAENYISYRSGYPADTLAPDSLQKPYGLYENKGGRERLLIADGPYEQYESEGQNLSGIYTSWIREQDAVKHTRDSIERAGLALQSSERGFFSHALDAGYADYNKDKKPHGHTTNQAKPYHLQLFRSWYSARINNDYFINRLQPVQGYLGTFKFPEVGAMMASGFSDLFENYHFNIGYKLPAGTEGSDFYARFENTKRTMDWHLMYFRKVESLQPDAIGDWTDAQGRPYPVQAKVKTWYLEAGVYFPLSYYWSLELSPAYRRGKTVFLSVNKYSLDFDNLEEWWNINTLTLKGSRLQPVIPMLYKGWELKTMIDMIGSYGRKGSSVFLYGLNIQAAGHLPLVKNITLVSGLKAGYSGGGHYIYYNFGGTDNNVVPRVDTTSRMSQGSPYAFQQLTGGLRAYPQNTLGGNAYGMLRNDLYFPLFRTLIPLRTGFSAVKNLQPGLFTDIAFARETWKAGSGWNSRIAFGFSLRTLLAGYPIRFDIGWPGSFNSKPLWYLSLSLE